jgi:hypothetical protein
MKACRSSYHRKATGRDGMRQRRAAAVCGNPVRSDGDDDVRADAERVVKVKEAAGRGLHDAVDAHALHVRCCAVRDRCVDGARVEPVHGHRRIRVQVPVVYGILGHQWREHEELTRSGDCGTTAG